MKIAALIARILLGLMFLVFGLNVFLHFIPAPPMSGLPGQYFTVMMQSHYFLFVGAVEVIAGLLLLTKQFVPLGLVLLAPVLVNIVIFHLTMQPSGLPMAFFAILLWCLVAWRVRTYLLPLLAPKATER